MRAQYKYIYQLPGVWCGSLEAASDTADTTLSFVSLACAIDCYNSVLGSRSTVNMVLDIATLDEKIERLREGDTLTENEVKALCEKVRLAAHRLLKRPRVI